MFATVHTWKKQVRILFLVALPVLMVLGVLTPIVGPAIDHHYADRTPVHAHVLNGEVTNEHDHSLVNHDHQEGFSGDGVSLATGTANGTGGSAGLVGILTLDNEIVRDIEPVVLILDIEHELIGRVESPRPKPPRISHLPL